MAGRPLTRKIFTALDKIGEEKIVEMYMNLGTMNRVISKLVPKVGVDISRAMFYNWLHKDNTGERWESWQHAKMFIAEGLVDSAFEDAENTTPETAVADGLKVRTKQWMAERYNKPAFSKNEGTTIAVSVGQDFLEALRSVESESRKKLDVPESDHEIIEEEY